MAKIETITGMVTRMIGDTIFHLDCVKPISKKEDTTCALDYIEIVKMNDPGASSEVSNGTFYFRPKGRGIKPLYH